MALLMILLINWHEWVLQLNYYLSVLQHYMNAQNTHLVGYQEMSVISDLQDPETPFPVLSSLPLQQCHLYCAAL